MARWELMTDHYSNTEEGAEWEHNETDLVTGKANRKRFPVPTYLPKGTIVCRGRGQRGDIAILGDPTPDMVPLDDEAEAISATFHEHWAYKPDTVARDYSQSLIADMADRMTQPVKIEGLEELVASVGTMAKQNQELIDGLVRRKLT